MESTPEANLIKYQCFALSAPPGPLVPGATVDFFVNPSAVTAVRRLDYDSLPPGTVMGGVIDAIWPRPTCDRLAVVVGNGACPDYWEVEEVHSERPPVRWSERESVSLFLPQSSIQIMKQETNGAANHDQDFRGTSEKT